ncbi:MAG: hypothetical protein R3C15_06640 [Thermoleophilia bacterium]
MRWTLMFVGSSLIGATCLGVAFATHHLNDWIGYLLFSFVVALPVVWGWLITAWALSSDTNADPAAATGSTGH